MRVDSGSFDLRRGGLLARESSSFVGRSSELRALHDQLRSPDRLVSLVGPRGIGKTRVALRYAGAHADHWPGGVWFCDVRHASTVREMTAIVLAAVSKDDGAPRREVDPAAIERALLVDARALLVLDNVEQLAPEVGDVVARWRDASPLLRILVTSRVPIAARASSSVTLGALDTTSSRHGRGEAVDLFLARATLPHADADAAYAMIERTAAGSLVAELGGVPFAIELAAFAARRDGARAVLDRMTEAGRAAPADPASAIERGFALLDPWARELLLQVSAFRGGFTLEAAAEVVELPRGAPPLSEALFALADRSLVELMRLAPLRFAVAESVRGHAEDQRRASGSWLAVEWRHAEYFQELAAGIAGVPGAPPIAPKDALLERENFATLLSFGSRMSRPEMVLRAGIALDAVSHGAGLSRAELAELDRALTSPAIGDIAAQDPTVVERALGVRASTLFGIGSLTESIADAERALAMAVRRGDRARMCALHVLAGTGAFQADLGDAALAHLRAAYALTLERADRAMTIEVLHKLGSVHLTLGHGPDALEAWERALALAVEHCEGPGEARVSMGLGSYFFEAGDLAQARAYYARGERLSRALEMQRAHRIVIAYQGMLELECGSLQRAETLLRRATLASRQAGDGRLEGFNEGYRACVLAARDKVDDARAAFDASAALVAAHAFHAELLGLLRAHLDLAEARQALVKQEWERAGWALACARGRVGVARSSMGGAAPLVERSDDARIALRLLDRMLGEFESQLG